MKRACRKSENYSKMSWWCELTHMFGELTHFFGELTHIFGEIIGSHNLYTPKLRRGVFHYSLWQFFNIQRVFLVFSWKQAFWYTLNFFVFWYTLNFFFPCWGIWVFRVEISFNVYFFPPKNAHFFSETNFQIFRDKFRKKWGHYGNRGFMIILTHSWQTNDVSGNIFQQVLSSGTQKQFIVTSSVLS